MARDVDWQYHAIVVCVTLGGGLRDSCCVLRAIKVVDYLHCQLLK
jgi:hypothetical protein